MIGPTSGRNAALLVLEQVERSDAYASVALDRVLARNASMSSADRALATELTYGVLRHRTRLDRAVRPHTKRGLKRAHPTVRRVLRLATFQLLMLDRIPASAAINEAVAVVKQVVDRRAGGFVNAVLRKVAQQGEPPLPDPIKKPAEYLREAASVPDWMAALILERLGPSEAVALADSLVSRPPLTIRANRLKQGRESLLDRLTQTHASASGDLARYAPDGLHLRGAADLRRSALYEQGGLEIQDEGAQLVGHLVNPGPKDRVLDACAGRGGKTLHLAALAGGVDGLVAADSGAAKLVELKRRAQRAGLQPPECIAADLTAPCPDLDQRSFDRILLDAPCSGLGVVRRHPEAKWRMDPTNLGPLEELQRRLLDRLAPRVRPGGLLVYAVCTFTRAEGPDQVASFLERHTEFAPEPPPARGDVAWEEVLDRDGAAVQTLPHRHGCDGFYMIRLRRLG
jgi:16S rRNA (cytosine967-C5)-methyltransferase